MIRRPPRSTRMTHSFPTRRSSDLGQRRPPCDRAGVDHDVEGVSSECRDEPYAHAAPERLRPADRRTSLDLLRSRKSPRRSPRMLRQILFGRQSISGGKRAPRSEEHTSELQSLMRISYAVFCLKKKKH